MPCQNINDIRYKWHWTNSPWGKSWWPLSFIFSSFCLKIKWWVVSMLNNALQDWKNMDSRQNLQHNFIPSPSIYTNLFPWELKRLASPQSSSSAPAGSGFKLTSLCEGREGEKRESEKVQSWRESWHGEHRMRVQAKTHEITVTEMCCAAQ